MALIAYDDPAEVRSRPCKLVFTTPDHEATVEALQQAGATIVLAPIMLGTILVAMVEDLDGFVIEIVSAPTTESPVLVAAGIGVGGREGATE